ncbi:FecR domain-containing protein [Chitinimonas lacunae]|uniref:FecR domain-containing protein n=1 Tax=Chitinimonas lacunae TaxID=1963018 RepID=A0ABV8MLA4_9NEIS
MPSAEIVSLEGGGEYRTAATAAWVAARVQQKLFGGQTVRTLSDGSMALLFADRSQLRLARNSQFEIKSIGDGRGLDTLIKLRQGKAWMQSKNAPDRLKFETPTAIAAIHGTDWVAEVADDGSTLLTVLSGRVELRNEQGRVSLGPGEQGQVQPGGAPSKRVLQNPAERVQWVGDFRLEPRRHPELAAAPRWRPVFEALARGAIGEAARLLDAEQSRNFDGAAALLGADLDVYLGDFAAARARLEQAAQQDQQATRPQAALIELSMLQGQWDEARRRLAALARPIPTEFALLEAELARFDGAGDAALAAYRRAQAARPADPRGWHGAGVVETERDNFDTAAQALARALSLDPTDPELLADQAQLDSRASRFAAAEAGFAAALAARPDDYRALTGLALLRLRRGEDEAALEAALKAGVIEPRYARAHVYAAVAYYRLGRADAAQAELGLASRHDPNDPLPYLISALIEHDTLRPGPALEAARAALARLPRLKSLQQLADDRKGSAGLGSALAFMGLEEWALAYARDSYDPFWAGANFFLAERLAGNFNRKSALTLGLLTQPTAIGAASRFQPLLPQPGDFPTAALQVAASERLRSWQPALAVAGYRQSPVPWAYSLQGSRRWLDPRQGGKLPYDDRIDAAFGIEPNHRWRGFLSLEHFRSTSGGLSPQRQPVGTGMTDRIDTGLAYRPVAREQFWLKFGQGRDRSHWQRHESSQLAAEAIDVVSHSVMAERDEQSDIAARASLDRGQIEWSFGAETARRRIDSHGDVLETITFLPDLAISERQTLSDRGRDRSNSLWLGGRLRSQPGLVFDWTLSATRFDGWRARIRHFDSFPNAPVASRDDLRDSRIRPQLGVAWTLKPGLVLRAAWQDWQRPVSPASLQPLAHGGIPVDDRLTAPGGKLKQGRIQLDWEIGERSFWNAFAARQTIDNPSGLAGPWPRPVDVSRLDPFRFARIANASRLDLLEGEPVFAQGTVNSAGLHAGMLLGGNSSLYARYRYQDSHSERWRGSHLPYLPRHQVALGGSWLVWPRTQLSAQAIHRSRRFEDEANRQPLPAEWEGIVRIYWESPDKRWNLDALAGNLGRRDEPALFAATLQYRF